MTDPTVGAQENLFPQTPGERLRGAREAGKLSLADIALQTRVPLRQLEAIENDDYSALPSVTYAVGFSRAYARAVGLDEVAIARDVRQGNSVAPAPAGRIGDTTLYEIEDPKRVPGRGLVWGGVIAALLVFAVIGLRYGASWFGGAAAPASGGEVVATEPVPTMPQPAAPTVAAGGQVTLTATDEVWMRVSDGGHKLFEGVLRAGDRFDVPATASAPELNVGRADKLQVTINGVAQPALGDGRVPISHLAISAAAIAARGPSGTATPGGVQSASDGAAVAPGTVPAAHRTTPGARSTPRAEPTAAAPPQAEAPTPAAPIPTPSPTAS